MRIFNNNEVKPQSNYMTKIFKHKEASDNSNKAKDQLSNVAREIESKKHADLIEISNEARRLQEEMERLQENAEASENAMEELGKLLEIARRISKGDKVPHTDEKKLMEYSSKLYMTAKAAALLRANEKHEEHDSLFDDEEDREKKVNGEEVTTVDAVVSDVNKTIDAEEVSMLY